MRKEQALSNNLVATSLKKRLIFVYCTSVAPNPEALDFTFVYRILETLIIKEISGYDAKKN